MTIGKTFRVLFMFLLSLIFLLSFSSCSNNQSTDQNGVLEDILSHISADKQSGEGVKPFATIYRIVLPEEASPDLYDKAHALAVVLSDATDTDAEVVYDYEKPMIIDGSFEILLGRTSRYQSKHLLESLRVDDYLCKRYEDSLVLGGIDDGATIGAIERFCRDILPEATKVVLLREAQEFFHKGQYEIEGAELNGFALSAYDIVYSADGSLDEAYYAKLLQKTILERSGYFLDVVADNEYEGGKYISIGADPKNHFGDELCENEARVVLRGANFLVSSDSKRGFEEIVPVFANKLLEANEEGVAEKWISEGVFLSKKYFSREVIFSAASDNGGTGVSIPKINSITSRIGSADAEFSFISHMNPDILSRVLFGLSGYKDNSENINGQVLSLLYRSGYPIEVTVENLYACTVICGKISFADGQELLVFNGYCEVEGKPEWIVQKVEEISDREGIPYIAMVSAAFSDTNEITFDNGRCIDKYLGLYTSNNISAKLLQEDTVYGTEFKDFSIKIDY